jgi:hypothetical protein
LRSATGSDLDIERLGIAVKPSGAERYVDEHGDV